MFPRKNLGITDLEGDIEEGARDSWCIVQFDRKRFQVFLRSGLGLDLFLDDQAWELLAKCLTISENGKHC